MADKLTHLKMRSNRKSDPAAVAAAKTVSALEPPAHSLQKMQRVFHSAHGPILIGTLAMEIGYSIETTRKFLNFMINRDEVRAALDRELAEYGLDPRVEAYVLTGDQSLSMTSW